MQSQNLWNFGICLFSDIEMIKLSQHIKYLINQYVCCNDLSYKMAISRQNSNFHKIKYLTILNTVCLKRYYTKQSNLLSYSYIFYS